MKTVEHLGTYYVVEGSVGAPDYAIFLDTLPAEALVELRNLLTEGLGLGRAIKMFQSKAKGIRLVTALLLKWNTEFDDEIGDELPDEMQPPPETEPEPEPTVPTGKWRKGTKLAMFIDMLMRPEGASIKELSAATNWLDHTSYGVISWDVKQRHGLKVTKSRVEGRGNVYRIAE